MEQLNFKTSGNNKDYKVKSICDSMIYTKKLKTGYLSSFYYLVS